ncbi:MAG TPA: Uma2 family endonuclease [Candidatus Angelobacter sp.]|nr:Uma2 family endonuclease [Candidatus Angelobacter sp.]
MSTSTRLTFDEFLLLPDNDERYELTEGELLVTPSPSPLHNIVRYRLRHALTFYVSTHHLGLVLDETDFRLAPTTVRKPDIAFLRNDQLQGFDLRKSPIEGSPTLAVEIISPSNSAQDMLLKVHQYLDAGSKLVWLLYPELRRAVIHDQNGIHELSGILEVKDREILDAPTSFSISLADLFNDDYTK